MENEIIEKLTKEIETLKSRIEDLEKKHLKSDILDYAKYFHSTTHGILEPILLTADLKASIYDRFPGLDSSFLDQICEQWINDGIAESMDRKRAEVTNAIREVESNKENILQEFSDRILEGENEELEGWEQLHGIKHFRLDQMDNFMKSEKSEGMDTKLLRKRIKKALEQFENYESQIGIETRRDPLRTYLVLSGDNDVLGVIRIP